mgnify:CR=1 FL=1
MTEDDMKIVVKIMLTADMYCVYCASNLVAQLVKYYPEHKQQIKKMFYEEYDEDYTEVYK